MSRRRSCWKGSKVELRLYRCRRCGKGFDYDIAEPKRCCNLCSGGMWEDNRGPVTPEDVFRIKEDTGVWATNDPPETVLDGEIVRIGSLAEGPEKEKQEARLRGKLQKKYGEAQWDSTG
jgi:rubredoxin